MFKTLAKSQLVLPALATMGGQDECFECLSSPKQISLFLLSPWIDLIHLHAKLEGAYHWLWPVHADVYNLDGLQLAEILLENLNFASPKLLFPFLLEIFYVNIVYLQVYTSMRFMVYPWYILGIFYSSHFHCRLYLVYSREISSSSLLISCIAIPNESVH